MTTKPAPQSSLGSKLFRTMIGTLSIIVAAMLVTVTALHVWTAQGTLALMEARIGESIVRKGQDLVTSQVRALTGLVTDNAFGDVRRLVEGTLREDPEVIYGLFLGADQRVWGYGSPTTRSTGLARPEDDAAWRELHLEPTLLQRTSVTHQRRRLFGHEIFQFSGAVLAEDGQTPVGTVVYGVSAAPLERALLKARNQSRSSLLVALGLFVTLTLATVMLGLLLVRKAAARITHPLAELTRATSAIAGGNRELVVSIRSRDELETLGDAFNQMVTELKESDARVAGMNHTLEQRVAERTGALADRNRALRLVLDTVNEGLLTLSPDGLLATERSAMIDRWFGPYAPPIRFVDYIAAIDRDFAESFELGFEALQEGVMPSELCLAQLPSALRVRDREFKLSYLPIASAGGETGSGDGQVVAVRYGLLVVVNDVTEQLALARKEAEQRELLAVVQGLARDRAGFLGFLHEANDIVVKIASGTADQLTHRRLLHTLKGNSSANGLNLLASLCHQAEDEDQREGALSTSDGPAALAVKNRWRSLSESVKNFLGERDPDSVEVSIAELEQLQAELADGASSEKVARLLAGWQMEPVERSLQRLATEARALSLRLNKGDLITVVEGSGVRLDPRRWAGLWSELLHVVRNAVDHGIESIDERLATGKPTRPRLRLTARIHDGALEIAIEDDGRGIDWEAIRKAASERGMPSASEGDLISALATPGITTRKEISTTSGRGIGLAAVHRSVQELQGTMSVSSHRGAGTCWRFNFPVGCLGPYEGLDVLFDESGDPALDPGRIGLRQGAGR